MPSSSIPNRRADARRSRAAVLDAAIRLLNDQPDATMDSVAAAAGVTRQTVYAHFSSRAKLRSAVLDRITEEAVAEMDAADLDSGPAAEALLRLVDAAARTVGRYPNLLRRADTKAVGEGEGMAEEDETARHEPVAERLRQVIGRGQRSGAFDNDLPVDWLVTVVVSLGHIAAAEADAGRLSKDEVERILRTTLLRVLGHR